MRILDFSDGFSSNSAPTQGSVSQNAYAVYANDAAFAVAKGSAATEGDVYYNSTTDKVRAHDGVQFNDLIGITNTSVGINYVLNSNGDSTSGWLTFKDAAASVPADGTGGAPSISFASSGSSPLRGDFSFLLSKGAVNLQGEGAAYAFTLASADKNKRLLISFDYEVAGGFVTGSASDVGVWIYDVTNSTLITPDNVSLLQSSGRFETTFNSTNSTSYRLIFFVRTTNAVAWTLKLDDVVVSPQALTVQSAPISDWISWTPTGTWVTNTVYTGLYRRVGNVMEMQVKIALTGAPTATPLIINFPTGFTADFSSLINSSADSFIPRSEVTLIDAAPSSAYMGRCIIENSSSMRVVSLEETGTDVRQDSVTATAPQTWAASDRFYISAAIPVAQWDSNIVLSNTRTMKMSSVLAFGTRVTATPTGIGEYRTLVKAAGALTSTDDLPSTAPSSTDGMRVYGNVNYATVGTAGQTNKWVIYVGVGRVVDVQFYSSTGKTGHAYGDFMQVDTTTARGILWDYDPTTGLVVVEGIEQTSATTTRFAAISHSNSTTGSTNLTSVYFDVLVSQTPLPIEAAHAPTHILGGSDVTDADQLAVDYVPTQYTSTPSAPYSSLTGHLSAHLNGINAKFAAGISNSSVSDVATFSTTSASYVVVTTMTATPTAGTYLVLFSSATSSSAGNNDVDYAIHLNGVEQTSTTRVAAFNGGGNTDNFRVAMYTQGVITTPGSQAIDLRARTNAGTLSVYQRNMILVRLA